MSYGGETNERDKRPIIQTGFPGKTWRRKMNEEEREREDMRKEVDDAV